jgi:hypothetical protein
MKKQAKTVLFYFILLLLSSKINLSNAQTERKKNDKVGKIKYFKAYSETDYASEKNILSGSGRTITNQSKYFRIVPSLAFTKIRKYGRLFEMSFALQKLEFRDDISENAIDSLKIVEPTRGSKDFSLAIGSQFEWAWQMLNAQKSQLYLGVSTNPILSYDKSVPYTTANFPFYQYDLTTRFSIVPRWCVQLNDKFLLDFNIPLTFWEVDFKHTYTGNPILPTFVRTRTEAKTDFVLKPSLRIGFGVRIY